MLFAGKSRRCVNNSVLDVFWQVDAPVTVAVRSYRTSRDTVDSRKLGRAIFQPAG